MQKYFDEMLESDNITSELVDEIHEPLCTYVCRKKKIVAKCSGRIQEPSLVEESETRNENCDMAFHHIEICRKALRTI